MNLMFRKNFREGGNSSSATKTTKLNKINRGGKRSLTQASLSPNEESFSTQYRTHLFFNARSSNSAYDETGLMNFLSFTLMINFHQKLR